MLWSQGTQLILRLLQNEPNTIQRKYRELACVASMTSPKGALCWKFPHLESTHHWGQQVTGKLVFLCHFMKSHYSCSTLTSLVFLYRPINWEFVICLSPVQFYLLGVVYCLMDFGLTLKGIWLSFYVGICIITFIRSYFVHISSWSYWTLKVHILWWKLLLVPSDWD